MDVWNLADSDLPTTLHRFNMQPLPTVYNCIEYRSRIEARWAVFFDTLGIPFEYEPEGFNLGDEICYLPDFWLPNQRCWVEIKGAEPTEDETEKAFRLAVKTGSPLFVFYHGIQLPSSQFGAPKAYAFFPDLLADAGYQWCECPDCGTLGITYEGRSDRLPCKMGYQDAMVASGRLNVPLMAPKPGCLRHGPNLDKHRTADASRLVQAYMAARAMRWGR